MRRWVSIAAVMLCVGCAKPKTAEDWLSQLKDADVVARREAIREVGGRTLAADRAVPTLAELLRDESHYVRHDAAFALGKFGPDAKSAVPALTAALKDKDSAVRTAAADALKKIDPTRAPPKAAH
jgi:HEAT repeat protein